MATRDPKTRFLILCLTMSCSVVVVTDAFGADALDAWRKGVKVSRLLDKGECHSVHSYFNTSPESPDGTHVVLYRSTAANAHEGEVCIVNRSTGAIIVLASNVLVEDVHRVACQQWVLGGRSVVFHDLRDGEWCVVIIDMESGKERVLITGRQVGWGQAQGDIVPLYGPHWEPGEHRDLELLNLRTGEVSTAVTIDATKDAYPDWFSRQFSDSPTSVFFPILSPDMNRVFFKVASAAGGGFRSSAGSRRYGIFCYDLREKRFLYMHGKWGHPAWAPDSCRIANIWGRRPVLVNCETGAVEANRKLPAFPSAHPAISPDGQLFAVDTRAESFGGDKNEWAIVVGSIKSAEHVLVHRFDNSQGARSWRKAHPHPVFSPDGRRVYFNVSSGPWTQLYVAEMAE